MIQQIQKPTLPKSMLQLQQIITTCNSEHEVSHKQLQYFIKILADTLKSHLQQKIISYNNTLHHDNQQNNLTNNPPSKTQQNLTKKQQITQKYINLPQIQQHIQKIRNNLKDQIQQIHNNLQQLHTTANQQIWRNIDQGRQVVKIIRTCSQQNKSKIKQLEINIQQIKQNINVSIRQLQAKVNNNNHSNLEASWGNYVNIIKFQQNKRFMNNGSVIKNKNNNNDLSSNNSETQTKIKAIDIINSQCYSYKNLTFNNASITAKNSVAIFYKQLQKTQENTSIFKIKINKLKRGAVIGLADSSYINKYDIQELPNTVLYGSGGYSWNGYQAKHNQGSKFQEGDSVEVRVFFKQARIQWRVYGKIVYENTEIQGLLSQEIGWVPFVGLFDSNDTITICL